MAHQLKRDHLTARDSTSVLVPDVKRGNILAADYVLTRLGMKTGGGWKGSYATGNPIWGTAQKNAASVSLVKSGAPSKYFVPDVIGMGARDAVYILESRGVKVHLTGRGKVKTQSIAPNTKIKKNMKISLELG